MLTVTEQRRPPTLFNSVGTVTPAPTDNSGGNRGKRARGITRLFGAYDDPAASVAHPAPMANHCEARPMVALVVALAWAPASRRELLEPFATRPPTQ